MTALLIVLVLCFAVPAALFVRLIGGEGSLRVVALIARAVEERPGSAGALRTLGAEAWRPN